VVRSVYQDYGSEIQLTSVEFMGIEDCGCCLANLRVVFHRGVNRACMYELKVDREYFQHDTFRVNGTRVAKSPHALTCSINISM